MEINDVLFFGKEAKEKILNGVNKLVESVSVTFGPHGKFAILKKEDGKPLVTKDGVTIANYINPIDPLESMGANLIKEAASKTVQEVGDGTTTTTILSGLLINGIFDYKFYVNHLDDDLEKIISYLKKNKISINTKKDIHKIAYTSSNKDFKLADIVSDLCYKVGKEGAIDVIETANSKTTYDYYPGYKVDNGWLHSGFINNQENNNIEFDEEVLVLLLKDKVERMQDIEGPLTQAVKSKRPLLVIAQDFDMSVVGSAIQNNQMGNRIHLVKSEGFNVFNGELLDDLAIYTDTEAVEVAQLKPDALNKLKRLGIATSLKINKNETIITNGLANQEVIKKRMSLLQGLLDNAKNEYDKVQLRKRLAKLNSGYGIIFVGGETPSEIKESFDRYEDAVGASISAMKDGVLPGAGCALFKAALNLDLHPVVATSLQKLSEKIISNANVSQMIIDEIQDLNSDKDLEFCDLYLLQHDGITNLFEEGILDPYNSIINALKNSISVAKVFQNIGVAADNTILQYDNGNN